MTKLSWTDDLTELAIKMWSEGASAEEIASAVGTTRNSVIGKMHREQLAGRAAKHPSRTGELPWNPTPVVVRIEKKIEIPATNQDSRVLFMEAAGMQCRWPLWGFNEVIDISEKYFCGQPTVSPSCSWCSEHLKIVAVDKNDIRRIR